MSEIRDILLAESGEKKIRWAMSHMPVLRGIDDSFTREKPLAGLKIALSIHLEAKTACLCRVLRNGGAIVYATGCNPLSTQDDVAAALSKGENAALKAPGLPGRDDTYHNGGIEVFAWHGATEGEYIRHLSAALSIIPNIIIDDGGDLVSLLHSELSNLSAEIIGGCEETTTGVRRLLAMEREGKLKFPMISVNGAACKHLFDNRYGTGQSVWDGIMRTTNLLTAGKTAVIAGYGWCGKGVALRAKGLGAKVIITETDPVKALEAVMDGFEVMTMAAAAPRGDIFITVTGCRDVIRAEHFAAMKNGAILANAGHFDLELDITALKKISVSRYSARESIMAYVMPDGRELFLLAEGRLVNIAAGDGHPAEIMDMSFAVQALSAEFLAKAGGTLKPGVIPVPPEIDMAVAFLKLASMNIEIDALSPEQEVYLA